MNVAGRLFFFSIILVSVKGWWYMHFIFKQLLVTLFCVSAFGPAWWSTAAQAAVPPDKPATSPTQSGQCVPRW